MPETRFVDAYDKRTGRKLDHLVPEHFVSELAGVTGLSATPRGKKADPVKDTEPAEPTTTTKDK